MPNTWFSYMLLALQYIRDSVDSLCREVVGGGSGGGSGGNTRAGGCSGNIIL